MSYHACEATGDNAIPQVLAQACAMVADGEADTDIVQITIPKTGGPDKQKPPHESHPILSTHPQPAGPRDDSG
jgi:hypothetical protein